MAVTKFRLKVLEATFQFGLSGVCFFKVSPDFAFAVFQFRYSASEEIVDYLKFTDPSLQVVVLHVEAARVKGRLHV